MKIAYTGVKSPVSCKEITSRLIPELIQKDPKVVYLDADLMGCIGTNSAQKTDDRMIDCGIAEANMVGIACGLSSAGFKPIVHSFAPFASRRVYDQAFISGGYAGNSITILGSDPGITATFNGGTHMPFEDMALYSALPGATVIDISDPAMLENMVRQCIERRGVKYIRFPRKDLIQLYERDSKFTIGKGIKLRKGKDAAIIASGIMVAKAMCAAEVLAQQGIETTVVDMFTVKPIDEALVLECAECGAVVTAENHNRIGGLTSAVAQILSAKKPTLLGHVAVEDTFGEVGPQNYLEERFCLTSDHIAEEVKAVVSRK